MTADPKLESRTFQLYRIQSTPRAIVLRISDGIDHPLRANYSVGTDNYAKDYLLSVIDNLLREYLNEVVAEAENE